MVKIKRVRTLDCVVMGWRPGTAEETVGSLILGPLRRRRAAPGGPLRRVHRPSASASCAPSSRPTRPAARGSGDPSRWSGDRELEWVELRPELVAEVSYDHASGGRIRHGARLLRFRDDRDPASCRFDQLDA